MKTRIPNLYLENAEILPGRFRNFSGKAERYNKEGNRNFNVVLNKNSDMRYKIGDYPPKYMKVSIQDLVDDGWNLRPMKPRDGDEEDAPPRYKLNVTVSFRYRPPEIRLYSGKRETFLDEETVGALDYADYSTADLTIRPRLWTDDDGTRKIKAYLAEMRVIIAPNRWEDKYAKYMEGGKEEDENDDLPF